MGGGDKALRVIGGVPLLDRVIERMRPQVETLVLNANGDPARFVNFGLPIVPDSVPDYAGPLAGVLAGLDWTAQHRPDCTHVVSVATDAPHTSRDTRSLGRNGASEESGADLACAASGGQPHPVIGLWAVRLREDLRRAIVDETVRKVDVWTARHRLAVVPFPDEPIDPFFNANRPEDLTTAAALLAMETARATETP